MIQKKRPVAMATSRLASKSRARSQERRADSGRSGQLLVACIKRHALNTMTTTLWSLRSCNKIVFSNIRTISYFKIWILNRRKKSLSRKRSRPFRQ